MSPSPPYWASLRYALCEQNTLQRFLSCCIPGQPSGPTAHPTESQSGTNWLLSFLLHPDFPVTLTALAVNQYCEARRLCLLALGAHRVLSLVFDSPSSPATGMMAMAEVLSALF